MSCDEDIDDIGVDIGLRFINDTGLDLIIGDLKNDVDGSREHGLLRRRLCTTTNMDEGNSH